MECKICGDEVVPSYEEHTLDGSAHSYCAQVNNDFNRGRSRMHIVNGKTNKVVVPRIDSEGYNAEGYEILSGGVVGNGCLTSRQSTSGESDSSSHSSKSDSRPVSLGHAMKHDAFESARDSGDFTGSRGSWNSYKEAYEKSDKS